MPVPEESPLPQRVLAAADDAARAAAAWWRGAGLSERAKALPETLSAQLDTLLDRVVAGAIADPLDVRTVDDARARLEEAPARSGGTATWVGALAARTKRTVSVGGKAVSLSMAAKLASELVSSYRLGAYELEVLASLLVHRLRDSGLPVDARVVRRLTVNAYVWPRRPREVAHRRPVVAARLAVLWAGRVLAVEPAVGRVTKAAEVLAAVDLDRLELPGSAA